MPQLPSQAEMNSIETDLERAALEAPVGSVTRDICQRRLNTFRAMRRWIEALSQ